MSNWFDVQRKYNACFYDNACILIQRHRSLRLTSPWCRRTSILAFDIYICINSNVMFDNYFIFRMALFGHRSFQINNSRFCIDNNDYNGFSFYKHRSIYCCYDKIRLCWINSIKCVVWFFYDYHTWINTYGFI